MAAQASQDNGCGTYSYKITGPNNTPASPSSTPSPAPTTLQMNCFPTGKFGTLNDGGVNEATELLNARDACGNWTQKGSTMNEDSQPLTATYSVGNLQYSYKISWQPNCTPTTPDVNFQAPMGDAQQPSDTQPDCPTILYDAYKKCKFRPCLCFGCVDLTSHR